MGELAEFIPPRDTLRADVTVKTALIPIVQRIAEVVPNDVIWDVFSSAPNQSNGKIEFPFARPDTSLMNCRNLSFLLTLNEQTYTPKQFQEHYRTACKEAFRALVWIEVGFQGMDNYAASPASGVWTSEGHGLTPVQREHALKTDGRKHMREDLQQFVQFRESHHIIDDLFSQCGVEYLLTPYKESSQ